MMVRLPHSVFKLILSYKDPRYERVRNGDPYEATPTRVWVTWEEFEENRSRYTSDPTYAHRIVLRKCRILMVYAGFSNFEFVEKEFMGEYAAQTAEYHRNYLRMPPDRLDPLTDAHYTTRNGILSRQCEACGPDLELYEMMRRRQ